MKNVRPGLTSVGFNSRTSVAVISLVVTACAPTLRSSGRPSAAKCEWQGADAPSSSGIQILSATTLALFSFGHPNNVPRGYMLLARGQRDWFRGQRIGGGGHVDGAGPREHLWRAGGIAHSAIFDPSTNTVDVLGYHIWLDTANVLLLDRVDRIAGEPKLVGTACIDDLDLEGFYRAVRSKPAWTPTLKGPRIPN